MASLEETGDSPMDFWPAFTSSFIMILATEIGDRTFFIAAIMAMKHPRFVVWAGAVGALVVMTVLSSIFGLAAIAFLPPWLVNWAVIVMMVYFGGVMVKEGLETKEKDFEELDEVQEELSEKEKGEELEDLEAHGKKKRSSPLRKVLIEAFILTFLAEWGDRSQMATIALSAVNNVFGVVLGAIIGHSLCTGFAVVGGRFLASYVSERMIHLSGGILFLMFGLAGAAMEISTYLTAES